MSRTKIVEILREKINPKSWNSFWLFAPATAIFLLPVCFMFLRILGLLGIKGPEGAEGEWIITLPMLFSIIYGILIGVTVLLLADKLEVPLNLINKIKWLAVFAIVTPFLSCLILIWVFCC